MYLNLKIEMLKKNISIEEIAKILNLHRNTVSYKINGKGIFDMDEADKIKTNFFPDSSIEYLFEKRIN